MGVITFCAAKGKRAIPVKLGPDRVAELLRQPNGLEKAANFVGAFEMYDQVRLWGRLDLKTLVSGSSAIVTGKVESASPHLCEDGDDIWTRYTVRPLLTLKGIVGGGDFTLSLRGGRVTFATVNTAQINTIESEHMQIGQQYVFFLQKAEIKGDTYSSTNGIEALFKLSTADGLVEPLAKHETGPHPVAAEVSGLSAVAFLAKVQGLVASEPAK